MKKEEIHLWDIKRILFGQTPPEFMLEVFIRSLVVYVIAIVVARWMGKRMNGQHTIIEMACSNCGLVQPQATINCGNCGANRWAKQSCRKSCDPKKLN